MKKIFLLLCIILLFSCKKHFAQFNFETVNTIIEDCVFLYVEEENIYYTSALSWGTTDYGKNIDLMRIEILFNKGNYKNEIVYNTEIENNIINELYSTFSNLNPNKNILQMENVQVNVYYSFKIIYPIEINHSKEEKEHINDLLWDKFEMDKIVNIYENYCEGWIDSNIDLEKFIEFMKTHFGDDIIIEM